MSRKSKLHELLAAFTDRASAAATNVVETVGAFKGKATDLFFGFLIKGGGAKASPNPFFSYEVVIDLQD
jgi:hypothetical protein